MIWLYNFLLVILAPIWVPMVLFRSRKRKESPNWQERMGNLSLSLDRKRKVVWVHAVSVGEVAAALPFLRELRNLDPTCQIVLSVTTSTGHQTARDRALANGLVDHLIYFPIDVARFMWVATWRVRPHAVAIFETELWMNFLHFSKQVGAKTFLVNGRISDRSFRRSMQIRPFYRALLAKLDHALMQSNVDQDRIDALGAQASEVYGNTKFDEVEPVDPELRKEWREKLGIGTDDFVLVIGSTRGQEEEEFVLSALSRIRRDGMRVVHAPRHIEGADRLEASARSQLGAVARRSRGETGEYLLLDTYGELAGAYAAADLAVIGGGFADLGGQNLIQPLACGVPVIHGPHMTNFREASAAASRAGASVVVATEDDLARAIQDLRTESARRLEMGRAGLELVEANRGASFRYAQAIIAGADEAFLAEQARASKQKKSQ